MMWYETLRSRPWPGAFYPLAGLMLICVTGLNDSRGQTSAGKKALRLESRAASDQESNPLKELDWMIGEWVATGDGYQARSTSKWSDKQKFIVSEFTVERTGGEALTGTQRIGWDPAASRIRSWVFDSDGGISQGVWRREGDSWVVKNVGVLPDGSRSSAANFWVPEGDGHYVVKSTHNNVNDEVLEDSVLEFHRVQNDK